MDELKIKTLPQVYEPREDSYLLAENLSVKKGDSVLEIGTGSGIQALTASRKAARVVAVDINPHALRNAKENAHANGIRNIEFRESNIFSNIKPSERFDLIIFNPPYVPSDEKDLEAKAWAGGVKGRETIDRFIKAADKHLKPGGRINLLVSSLNDPDEVVKELEKKKLEVKVVARQKLWFEELFVLLAEKQ